MRKSKLEEQLDELRGFATTQIPDAVPIKNCWDPRSWTVDEEIEYIWNEREILEDLFNYIDSTYNQHYAGDQVIQTTEYIASNLEPVEAIGAFKFNIMKYTARYGKKDGKNKKDLLKAMHYLVMLMAVHDRTEQNGE